MNHRHSTGPEIDAWLREGGTVAAASERAARSLIAEFDRARRAEGLGAWPAPQIQDWQRFVRGAWDACAADGRMVLNAVQEQALWASVVAEAAPQAARLAGARDRLAALAMDAHRLLCEYAPHLLNARARGGWDQDAGAFSGWAASFQEVCRDCGFVSAAQLAPELAGRLRADHSPRQRILLAGFDRLLPTQRDVLAAWGNGDCVRESSLDRPAREIAFYAAADANAELTACALWAKTRLAAQPGAQLLVVTQDVRKRRGEMERVFRRHLDEDAEDAAKRFEFSLGVPLGKIGVVRSVQLLLRGLGGAIEESEFDWLLGSGRVAVSQEETRCLVALMRELRRRGWERPRWTVGDFLRQRTRVHVSPQWAARMTRAELQLKEFGARAQTPVAWAEFVPRLIETAGWPGARPLTSAEFQALRRWQQTLDDCGSLGFDGRRMGWEEFLAALDGAVEQTLFAPESEEAPILIAGPAESAGLSADAIWFLGASEEGWPAAGVTHPLIPLAAQRQAEMPHAWARLDWEFAGTMTRRLLASAGEVHFSYARQSEGVEARASRLIVQVCGEAQPLPVDLWPAPHPEPVTSLFLDDKRVPFPRELPVGGASVLTSQSRCAFQGFAAARLDADAWKPAEAGLTRLERGTLLHAVLAAIWAGAPDGIRTQRELTSLPDLATFVAGHVQRELEQKMPSRVREHMPAMYLELECRRLIGLITEWLRFEQMRLPFAVVETESAAHVSIAGLPLRLRLDRVDRLNDGSLLVIDYKTGDAKAKSWDLPRPDDVQLPLYAGYALKEREEDVGGLTFAKLRAGDNCFEGRVRAAKQTLSPSINGNSNLVRKPLTEEALEAWRAEIRSLAERFLAGDAQVNPREYPETCKHCGLRALCRIDETQERTGITDDGDGEEAASE